MVRATSESIRVLHIDDDPAFTDLTATWLERQDDRITVETETSASDGLARLAEDRIDCIVSDYDMPETDGIELLKSVRDDHPNLPFILFTGKGSEAVASEAVSAGVSDYLQKGSGSEQYEILCNRIENVVKKRRAAMNYRELFEKVHIGLTTHDPETGRITDVNPGFEEIVGYSKDELIGTHPGELSPEGSPFTRERADDLIRKTLENGPQTAEWCDRTKDGEKRWIEVNLRRTVIDGRQQVLAIVQDITEQKERKQELKETTRQLQTVLDTVEASIFIKDTEGRYQLMNQECRRLLGIDPDEDITGVTDDEILPADIAAQYQADDQRVIKAGETLESEVEVPTPGGTQINRTIESPFYDEDGELVGVCAVSTDITERKQRQQELQQERDRLDEFAGVVSHDLRNPLQVAQGRLELAREECDSGQLDRVDDALARMDRIIEDMLRLAREGRQLGSKDPVALRDVVVDAWDTVADTADAASLRYGDDEQPLPTVEADADRLRQLFENLLRNAIEHGGQNMTVTVGRLDDGVYVEDDGPGIPRDDREDAFTAGYTTTEDGTGFGLSIVKRIVDAHGWEITVTEGTDDGARFEISGIKSIGK